MPTVKPRTQITHTAKVEHALEVARKRWPGETRTSVLLERLIETGAETVEHTGNAEAGQRQERLRALADRYSAAYGPGYLEEVREGWDE